MNSITEQYRNQTLWQLEATRTQPTKENALQLVLQAGYLRGAIQTAPLRRAEWYECNELIIQAMNLAEPILMK